MFALLALIAAGAFLYAQGKKSSRAAQPQYALPPPASPVYSDPFHNPYPPQMQTYPPQFQPRPPTPMDVLVEFMRRGKQPPPIVIMCAIAQVEALGRNDLAQHIIRVFIQPTVQAYYGEGGTPPSPENPQGSPAPQAAHPGDPSAQGGTVPPDVTDAQLQALLNTDPEGFMNRVARGDVIDIPAGPEQRADGGQAATEQPGYTNEQAHADAPASNVQVSGTVVGAVARRALPSPITNVDGDRWSTFTERLAREAPTFHTARHVGRYRQRKERLDELGIDPKTIVGSLDAQLVALNRDLEDAYRHATEGGLVSDHVLRRIPIPGQDEPVEITASGVLGVIQAAGLEGAVGWLESYNDRKRYPNTTAAFIRTNGVF